MFSSPAVVLLLALGSNPGETPPAKTAIANYAPASKLAEKATSALAVGGLSAILDVAFSGDAASLKVADRANAERLFRSLFDQVEIRFGKALGRHELVRTDVAGDSLVRFVYVQKWERGPMLWYLTFYRGDGGAWVWNGFNFTNGTAGDLQTVPVDAAEFKGARTLATEGVDAIKKGGVDALLDAVLAPGKTILLAGFRGSAALGFGKARDGQGGIVGKSSGQFDLARVSAIGKSLVRYTYLEKCARGVIVWDFTFYRADDNWQWQDVNIHGDASASFSATK